MTGALARLWQGARGPAASSIEGGGGQRLAADALLATAEAIARALRAQDLAADEPVLCVCSNAPLDLAGLLGIWLAGGVAVPIHASAASTTSTAVRRASGSRLSVSGGAVEQLLRQPPAPRELLRGAALIVFTSGSTGTPKGVVLGHQQLAGKLEVLARLIQLCPADTVILPLQLTFIYGIWVSLLTISSGARLVLLGKFTASELAAKLRDGGSVMAVVPSMLRGLLASEPQPAAPRLKSLICGGEMLSHRLGRALLAAFPHTGIFDLYGLTETGSCDFCLPPAQFAAGLGSIGGPTEKVHYRIVDANAAPVDPGAAGELLLKTPFGMLGYLDDPGLTAGSYRHGFFCTGDQAKLRPDGRLQIVGRLKDMISRGGNKIAPAEIDTLLASHPEVSGALCAGVPDARLGEVIHAVVTLHPQSRLTPHTLLCWAAGQIEKFKLPDVIHIREALPTGPSGKLDRAAIVRLALAEGEAPPT